MCTAEFGGAVYEHVQDGVGVAVLVFKAGVGCGGMSSEIRKAPIKESVDRRL